MARRVKRRMFHGRPRSCPHGIRAGPCDGIRPQAFILSADSDMTIVALPRNTAGGAPPAIASMDMTHMVCDAPFLLGMTSNVSGRIVSGPSALSYVHRLRFQPP